MGKKETDERIKRLINDDVPAHRKRSNSASKSVSGKRSSHKHDYEKVIICSGFTSAEFYWGRRCRICGRVDDSGMFRAGASDDFIKVQKEVRLQGGYTCVISEFYSAREIKKKFPEAVILKYDFKKRQYEELED